MAGNLTFLVDDTLRAIVEHARNSPTRSPNYAELYDPACRKDGKEPAEDVFPTHEDVDPAKIPYGLWLVKDRGVYLMSPGNPRLQDPNGHGSLVAYALEANPASDDCWDMARAIMGGDDCVEKIDLAFIEKAIKDGLSRIIVTVSPTGIDLNAHA